MQLRLCTSMLAVFALILCQLLWYYHCLRSFVSNQSTSQSPKPKMVLPYPRLGKTCQKLAFDIGTNTGKDALSLLQKGYCVIGVDANPLMIEETEQRLREHNMFHPDKVVLLPIGIEEFSGSSTSETMPFYVTTSMVHSSFEYSKALRHSKIKEVRQVPVFPSESLFGLLPDVDNFQPEYFKVDIEERHFTCIESLLRLPYHQLPMYISWEMHEHAKGLKYPVLDTRVILDMHERLGYNTMKWSVKGGTTVILRVV